MTTLRTTPMRVLVDDIKPVRLIADLQRRQPADVVHAALAEYFANHREELSRLHVETHDFIARGDVDGLAAVLQRDAAGTAERLAARGSRPRASPELGQGLVLGESAERNFPE